MVEKPEFLLEKLVHYVVREDGAAARELLNNALRNGRDSAALLAEIVLPAVECIHQLRADAMISLRIFNAAVRALSGMLHRLKEQLPSGGETRRGRVMILSAPLEQTDLGAQVLATLAECHGFEVQFAGAHLEAEELVFACTRLEPDAVLIHGSLGASSARVRLLIERLHAARVGAQVAVAGAMAGGGGTLGADVAGEEALGVLEMMALCPEYRAQGGLPMELMEGSSVRVDAEAVRAFLGRLFPRRAFSN